ncbi:MAG: TrkH family potassium uptake protein [Eubacterium sp.]|nr:TrkH family potassium uptake protein [Eubacterium sp.]
MNYKAVLSILGRIFIILGALMLVPLAIAVYYTLNGFAEASYTSFVIPMIIFILTGLLLNIKKPKDYNIYAKEGFVICGLGWIIMSIIGALPFVISGAIPNYIDALFETASGFSTTGSSILNEIHSLPKSILFWRSFTQWIGGMGILSFMIAVVPRAKSNSMLIMRAEAPGPSVGKVVSKTADSARILYIIYIAMTVIEIAVLFVGTRISGDNMRFYDCVVNSLTTASTGGFSVLNDSIRGYNSAFTEWTITIFMYLFGVNFNLYFFILTKRWRDAFKDEEFRAYTLINVICVVLITLNIFSMYDSIFLAVRDSFFTVNTIMSSTGFGTVDFNAWPTFSKILLLILMCIGGSAGSTGGGFKVIRVQLLFKQMLCNFRQLLRPHSVVNVRYNGKTLDKKMMGGINSYLTVYIVIMIISLIFISFDNFSTSTSFSAVLTCLNNIGPGIEAVGPKENFANFSDFSKLVLIFDMLAGRLELFPILLLFSPNTWKKAK